MVRAKGRNGGWLALASRNTLFRVAWLVLLLFSGAYTPDHRDIMHMIKNLRANFQSDPILPISHTALFFIIFKAMLQFQISGFPAFFQTKVSK